jgi:LAS superfamily LD-carboxypeptidase LdcB
MSPRRAGKAADPEASRAAVLTGLTEAHLCSDAEAEPVGARVHRDVLGPFRRLQEDARAAGFDLRVLSGFRGFDRQLSIWNRKAGGQLAVLDGKARPLDIARLSERELVLAILRWSALPGASRHHWGTDLDVYDRAAQPPGYEIELIPAEVDPGGMFGPLHQWLDERIASGRAHGFFRPYDRDGGGVAPERWHLSHAPTAGPYLEQLTLDLLRDTVRGADLALKATVLATLDEIYRRFVVNVNRPPA